MAKLRIRRLVAAAGLASSMAVAGIGAPSGVAVAGGAQDITVKATEFGFQPATIPLTVGQPVQLTIVNGGVLAHDMKSELPISRLTYIQADNPADEQAENTAEGVLDVDYGKGEIAKVTFVPTKAGTYTFMCDVPGHADAGMKGSFVVTNGQAGSPDNALSVAAVPTLSGHLEAGTKGHFAYYAFTYPGDQSAATVNLQASSDDAVVRGNVGFNVYGPQRGKVYATGGAQPGMEPNVSGNLISGDAGTYLVQVYNYDPDQAIDFTIQLGAGSP
jgi:uncharacterized cupredoxin-like copper-binding protein